MTGRDAVLVVGEALTDVLVTGDGARRDRPGGGPANTALGLARLGHRVRLATRIGDDAAGRRIRDHLGRAGVELTPGSVGGPRTSRAVARLGARGLPTYDFDITWSPRPRALRSDGTGPPAHLHTGSLAAALAPGADLVLDAVTRARTAATVSYDPNLRPPLLGTPERERPRVERLVALSDVVKASAEDLEWLHPGRDPRDVAADWAGDGPALVVLTLGPDGALACWRHGRAEVPGRPVDVVDTVGAGDAFMAGLLSGLLRAGLLGAVGGGPEAARDARAALSRATGCARLPGAVADALQLATHVAALTCTRPGADPPTAAELV
ncbi:carbohydrate kinase family protein [Streptomyces sp. NPDC002676]